jgi:hypothetical protein
LAKKNKKFKNSVKMGRVIKKQLPNNRNNEKDGQLTDNVIAIFVLPFFVPHLGSNCPEVKAFGTASLNK